MKPMTWVLTVTFVFALFPFCLRGDEAGELPFPTPEAYSISGAKEYLKAANEFINKHGNSPHAPRVAFDVLMLGTIAKSDNIVKEAKQYLLLKQPRSLQAAYVIITFKDAGEYRRFLSDLIDEKFFKQGLPVAGALHAITQMGITKFGPTLMKNDATFALKWAFIANIIGDKGLQQLALKAAEGKKGMSDEMKKIVRICFDDSVKPAQKIPALHEMSDPTAKLFEKYYIGGLSPDDLQKPGMARIVVENHLRDRAYVKALPLVKMLCSRRADAQRLMWLAICQVGLDKPDKAVDALKQLQKKYPKSPWAAPAKEYCRCIEKIKTNLQANTDALHPAIVKIKKGVDALEFRLRYVGDKPKSRLTAYLALDIPKGFAELLIRDNKGVMVAFRTDKKRVMTYVRGESTIYQFDSPGFMPVGSFDIVREPNGKYSFLMQFNMASGSAAGKTGLNLLKSTTLEKKEAVADMLAEMVRTRAYVPATPVKADGKTTFTWMRPKINKPGMEYLKITIADKNAISSISFNKVHIENIRYGPKGSVKFAGVKWPEARIVTGKKEVLMMSFMKIIMQIGELYSEKMEN